MSGRLNASRSSWFLVLLVILALAAALRLYRLDFQSLWLNELDSWWMSHFGDLDKVLGRTVIRDPHPPGFQLLLLPVIRWLGDSEAMLRLPSALFGILAVWAIALLGRRLFDPATGLLAAALLACSGVAIYYSQEARSYSALLLTSIVSTHLLVGICQRAERGERTNLLSCAAYVLTAACACYLHYFGVLLVVFHGLLLVLRLGIGRLSVGLIAGVALLYLPWLPGILEDLAMKEHYILRARWSHLPDYYVFVSNDSWRLALLAVLPFHVYALWSAASDLRRQPAGLRSWRRDSSVLLALWIVVPVGLAFTKSMVSLSVFTNRNLMICLAPLLLLLARGVTVLPLSRRWRTALGVLLPVVFLIHLVFVRDYYEKPTKVGYRGAVQAVLTRDPAGEVPVVGCRSAYYYDYYFARLGSDRRVGLVVLVKEDRGRLLEFLEQSGQDSFWLVQGWFFPPKRRLQVFLDRWFEVVEQVESTGAKATLYRRRAKGSE